MRPVDKTGLGPSATMGATAEELTIWRQHMNKNKLHTLARLSRDEVSMIWSHVSDFILRQLRLQKGVYIPAFGTFTFMRQKLDAGNRFSSIQIPIFIMSEKLLQLHGLRQTKIHTPGDIPVVPLNFIMVAIAGHYIRDTVEGCIKETLQLLSRSICTRKKVEFTFQGIGILTIENDKVKMKFFQDFLSAVDTSGNLEKGIAKVMLTFTPQSVNSTLANIKNLKRSSNCVLSFPRIEFKLQQNNETTETSKRRKSVLKMKPDKDDVQVNFLPRPPGQKPTPATGNIAPELCYVCMQRRKVNSALYSYVKNKEEDQDDQILHQYQIMKDKDTAFKDQLRLKSEKEECMKNAAYNLGVADAIKSQRNPKCHFSNPYYFDNRPASAAIVTEKKNEFTKNLLKQIDASSKLAKKKNENQKVLEQLERLQLKQEIDEQKAELKKHQFEEREMYKKALEYQLKHRPSRLPIYEPMGTFTNFGQNEKTLEAEKRQRNIEYMKQQVEAAAGHRRQRIISQIKNLQQEKEMLQKNQEKHLAERCAEEDRRNTINQHLRKEWDKDVVLKHQRDEDVKAFDKAPDKLFILDQCNDYKRCKQCQRDPSNKGKTHFWPYNKHLPGSLMLM
ncbi:coiled-coil domain-containing protein 81-like [Erinaceus europaeus]|uniref:Coiled-coil domain-containing protein 81-like n=1 Tax=Erinaceus europaeus TaxID=9365 RepID=A0ABM3W5E7_ERIEU|nr:coiled-coil domain-containing protein 81-like [Erinaceus europaeus]